MPRLRSFGSTWNERLAVRRPHYALVLLGRPAAQPAADALAGLPPLLIHAASGDAVLQEAQLLARHATQCGVEASITVYPVPTHDFHIFWSFLPEARDAIDEIGRFVRTATSTPGQSAASQPG